MCGEGMLRGRVCVDRVCGEGCGEGWCEGVLRGLWGRDVERARMWRVCI